jgi:ankyrin repeat protein
MNNNRKNQIEKILEKLLEMGYFQMNDEYGRKIEKMPLALEDSAVQIVRKLIEMGVDISQAKWERKANVLHVASQYAKTTELIDVILETGQFDIDGVDNNGDTPLLYAINGRNPTIARHLIQMEADPEIANKNGITPLQFEYQFQVDEVKYLLKILSF